MLQKRRLVLISLIAAVVFTGGLTAFTLYEKNSSSLDFQAYAPQTLPSGLHVTERTLDIWSDDMNPFASKKIVSARFNDSKGYISQTNKSDYTSAVVTCGRSVTNQTCEMLKTPKGQKYKAELTYGTDQELSTQTYRWFKDGTYIWLSLRGEEEDDIDLTIDSFRPVTYDKLPIKHYSPGP